MKATGTATRAKNNKEMDDMDMDKDNGNNGTDVLRYCDLPDCPWHEPRPNCNMRRGNFLKYDGDQ